MHIFIPTLGRASKQRSLEWFSKELCAKTILVPSEEDYKEHKHAYKETASKYQCAVMPINVKGIAATREYIGRHLAQDKFVMVDDDLSRFLHRKHGDPAHLYINKKRHTERMFSQIEKTLDNYAHVGISARANNNAITSSVRLCSRYIRILAYRKKEYCECVHGRVPVMEDFDIALQLLRKGYKSCVLFNYAHDQVQTQLPGGCSTYRDHKLQEDAAKELKRLHPNFVALKWKKNTTGGEFGFRMDVTVQWDQAYKSSIKNKLFQ